MAVVITSPRGPLPSDNRIVFGMIGDLGTGQQVTPEQNNFLCGELENVSGNYSTGVWNVLNPLPDSPIQFIKLPNIGTELLLELFALVGATPPDNLPDNLDRYEANNLQLEFSGGTTATLTGELVSIDDPAYIWDVNINLDNPVDLATWQGAGGEFTQTVPDVPMNRIVFNDGMAAGFSQANLEAWIGEAATDYTNDGTTITFSNVDYGFQALSSPSLFPVFSYLAANMVGLYSYCAFAVSFSGFINLQVCHLYNSVYSDISGFSLFNSNAALEEVYFSGGLSSGANLLFNSASPALTNVRRVYLPNVGSGGGFGANANWLNPLDFSQLELWINVLNQTNNGGGVQAAVAAAISGGATVNYNNLFITPEGINQNVIDFSMDFWQVAASSTLTGKTGSPLEGISLDIENPLGNNPGMQAESGAGEAGNMCSGNAANSMSMNFTITGATIGSIFFGLNSYSYEITVLINGTEHSTHRLFFTPGQLVKFDASQITRSVIGRPRVPTLGVDSSFAYGTVRLRVKVRTSAGVLSEEYLSDNVVFWKARLNEVDFFNWEPTEYLPSLAGTSKFLTNYPRDEQRLVLRGGNYYMGMFYPGTPLGVEDVLRVRRRQFASEGGSLMATEFVSPVGVVNDGLPKLWKVGVINLGGTGWGTLAGSGFYSVDLFDTDTDLKATESLGLTVWDGECNRGATVHFLNKLGGVESYYFTRRKLEEGRLEGFSTEKDTGEFDPQENGEHNYLIRALDRITLRSDWLSESVQNWLVQELFESPFILIEIDGVQVRAKSRETTWTKRTIANDTLFDVNAEFEISERRYSPLV